MHVIKLFEALAARPTFFLNAETGREFEDRIMNYLKSELPFTRYMPDESEHIAAIKEIVLKVEDASFIKNTSSIKNGFVYQPYNTQSYPDFLIFEGNYILPVEIKFSTDTKKGAVKNAPVWNSGLPRLNGIYIYGSLPRKSIAIFYGADVITIEERKKLLNFFNNLTEQQDIFNARNMSQQEYGFAAYSRTAFQQQKKFNPKAKISFIDERENLAKKLLDRLKAL